MERLPGGQQPDVIGLETETAFTVDGMAGNQYAELDGQLADNVPNTGAQLPEWVGTYYAMHEEAPQLFQAMKNQGASRANRTTDRISDDLVRVYLQDIGRYPLLTTEGELHLARRIRLGEEAVWELDLDREVHHLPSAVRETYQEIAEKTKADTTLFLASNLRLVVSIAKKYQASGIPLLDLIQEGNIGLEHALTKFEPEKGNKFSTYATWWIKQAVQRGIYDNGRTIRLPVHAGEKSRAITQARNRLTVELGHEPNEAELAAEMDMDPVKLRTFLADTMEPVSLEAPIGENGEHELKDVIEDKGASSIEERFITQALGGILVELAHEILDERERDVLFLRHGLSDGSEHTYKEIAELTGLQEVRVRQIEQRAIAKFRHPTAAARLV